MVLIRYVDIIDMVRVEDGYIEEVTVKDATIPIIIDPSKIGSVQPYFNKKGKLYKNVSFVNYEGEVLKVVGNYIKLDKFIKGDSYNNRLKVTGYKNYAK